MNILPFFYAADNQRLTGRGKLWSFVGPKSKLINEWSKSTESKKSKHVRKSWFSMWPITSAQQTGQHGPWPLCVELLSYESHLVVKEKSYMFETYNFFSCVWVIINSENLIMASDLRTHKKQLVRVERTWLYYH